MSGKITITNTADNKAVIDIEGIIGVPEDYQFDEPGHRIATYQSFSEIIEKIKILENTEIIVNIRSTGGNVNDALLIHDALKGLGVKITTRCFGYVASAATIIAQAASENCREISSNSLYLIHKSVCSTEGNTQALSQTLEMLDKTDQRITAIYAVRSGRNASEFVKLMDENNGNGRWLSPEEAIEKGLADHMIPASPIQSGAKETVLNLGLPPIPKKRANIAQEISKKWNSVLEAMGFIQDNAGDNAENTAKVQEVIDAASLETAAQEVIGAQREAITKRLDTEIARAAALPTSTKPKEDPSAQEINSSRNENAYQQDIKKIIG